MVRRKPRRRGHGHGLGSRNERPEYSTRSDLALIKKSVDGAWRVPQETRDELVAVCWGICRDGGKKDRDRLAAARVLVSASKSPQHGTFVPSYEEQGPATPVVTQEELIEALGVLQEAAILPPSSVRALERSVVEEAPDNSPPMESSP